MDGVPVFNLVRETLPAVNVTGFRGVVNSTTNFILTAMEQGQPFDAALAEMQARGHRRSRRVARRRRLGRRREDGGARQRAARRRHHAARRRSAGDHAGDRAARGRRAGGGPTAEAGRAGAARRARRRRRGVGPEELPADDLLAGLEGQQNALILETDLLEEIAIVQRGGEPDADRLRAALRSGHDRARHAAIAAVSAGTS